MPRILPRLKTVISPTFSLFAPRRFRHDCGISDFVDFIVRIVSILYNFHVPFAVGLRILLTSIDASSILNLPILSPMDSSIHVAVLLTLCYWIRIDVFLSTGLFDITIFFLDDISLLTIWFQSCRCVTQSGNSLWLPDAFTWLPNGSRLQEHKATSSMCEVGKSYLVSC